MLESQRFFLLSSLLGALVIMSSIDLNTASLSGKGYATQTCLSSQSQGFYCPFLAGQEKCLPRNDRCSPTAPKCVDGSGHEPGCHYSKENRAFAVHVYYAKLTGRRRKRSWITDWKLTHEGVNFHGFEYEFGMSYPNGQELDVLDPLYKYKNGDKGYRLGELKGYSRCSRQDAYDFMRRWTSTHSYSFLGDRFSSNKGNCQTFTRHLVAFLLSNCDGKQSKRRAWHGKYFGW